MYLRVDDILFEPSSALIIHEGLGVEGQKDIRLASVYFIRKLGRSLGLYLKYVCKEASIHMWSRFVDVRMFLYSLFSLSSPHYTISSATLYFHYFFMFYSMKKYTYIVSFLSACGDTPSHMNRTWR